MAVFILRIPGLNTKDIADVLDWIFTSVVPNYCMGQGLMNMYSNYEFTQTCEKLLYKLVCQRLQTNITLSFSCCKGELSYGCKCVLHPNQYFSLLSKQLLVDRHWKLMNKWTTNLSQWDWWSIGQKYACLSSNTGADSNVKNISVFLLVRRFPPPLMNSI